MRTDAVSELIAEVCDRVILPRFRALDAHEVEHKRPGDVVTIADREAEAELTAAFRAATPDALVVGEEASFADPSLPRGLAGAAHAWVIDPVDGTRNFASGSPDFGVMVAEVRDGATTRGWIWQPQRGDLYVAERGGGATCNGTPLVRVPAPTPDAPTPDAPTPDAAGAPTWTVAVWPKLARTKAPGLALRGTRGSCAIDYPALARGEIDGLAYRSIHPWDHLAGTLLVREVGGDALVDGRPYAPGVTGRMLAVGASLDVARAVGERLAP